MGPITAACGADAIVVDSNCTDVSKIPFYWLEKVKDMVLIHTGQSHGRQVPYGLANLEAIDSTYAVEISTEGIPLAADTLRVSRALRNIYNSWSLSVDTTGFWDGEDALNNVRRTLDYHAANGDRVDAILHTWSWDFRYITEVQVDNYLAALSTLESEYPDVTFIYMSDTDDNAYNPSDPNEHWAYNWLQRRNQIKTYVLDNGKTLFDFGEIETWSADGTEQRTFIDWYYNVEIPLRHSDLDGNYDGGEGGCHINEAGTVIKAKAMWWLLARIAGWDGCPAVEGDINGDCKVNFADLEIMYLQWLNDNCGVPGWCQGSDLNKDGNVGFMDFAKLAGEWTGGCANSPYGDINGDCKVDFIDLRAICSQWLNNNCGGPTWCGGVDLNKNGNVDFSDFATLAADWLKITGF